MLNGNQRRQLYLTRTQCRIRESFQSIKRSQKTVSQFSQRNMGTSKPKAPISQGRIQLTKRSGTSADHPIIHPFDSIGHDDLPSLHHFSFSQRITSNRMGALQGNSTALGTSIPADTPHAISVSLPTWRDNVGYEEGEARVVQSMVNGYPRFFIHLSVNKVRRMPITR